MTIIQVTIKVFIVLFTKRTITHSYNYILYNYNYNYSIYHYNYITKLGAVVPDLLM